MANAKVIELSDSRKYLEWMEANAASVQVLGVAQAGRRWGLRALAARVAGEKGYRITFREIRAEETGPVA